MKLRATLTALAITTGLTALAGTAGPALASAHTTLTMSGPVTVRGYAAGYERLAVKTPGQCITDVSVYAGNVNGDTVWSAVDHSRGTRHAASLRFTQADAGTWYVEDVFYASCGTPGAVHDLIGSRFPRFTVTIRR